jgi:hypothetical protein
VAAAQAEGRANACAAEHSCRKPATAPRGASCGADLSRRASLDDPAALRHAAGAG